MAGINQEFEVGELLDVRLKKGKKEYLVKWKNFSEEHNSWEPKENLRNCQGAIEELEKKMVVTRSGLRVDAAESSPTSKSKKKNESPSPKKRSSSKGRSASKSRSTTKKRSPSKTRSTSRTRTPAVGRSPARPRSRSRSRSRVTKAQEVREVIRGERRTEVIKSSGDSVDSTWTTRVTRRIDQRVADAAQVRMMGDEVEEKKTPEFKAVVPRGLQKQKSDKSRDFRLSCSDIFVILLFTLIIVGIVAYQYGYLTEVEKQLHVLYDTYFPTNTTLAANKTSESTTPKPPKKP